MCALTTCPGGLTSVVVGGADLESRRLLDAKAGRSAEPRRLLPRCLIEVEAITFAVPTQGSGGDSGEGGVTGIQYAATLINQIADPVRSTNLPRLVLLRFLVITRACLGR